MGFGASRVDLGNRNEEAVILPTPEKKSCGCPNPLFIANESSFLAVSSVFELNSQTRVMSIKPVHVFHSTVLALIREIRICYCFRGTIYAEPGN